MGRTAKKTGETAIMNNNAALAHTNSSKPGNNNSQALVLPDDASVGTIKQMAALTTEQNERIAGMLWLRGYSMVEIANTIQASTRDVVEIIKQQRSEIAEWHKDEIESLRGERIEALRQIARRAWTEYEVSGIKAGARAQLLSIITKIEETIAKMQGVVENKHVYMGDVEHHHKVYDFQPENFPDAIDAEVKVLSE